MKKLALLLACSACVFGYDQEVDSVDRGGVRVSFSHVVLEDGSGWVDERPAVARGGANPFDGDSRQLELAFEFEGHQLRLDAHQIERLTTAGGQAALYVDNARQIVDVQTSVQTGDLEGYASRDAELSFDFDVQDRRVSAFVVLDVDFHCPPYDTTPATVEVDTLAFD